MAIVIAHRGASGYRPEHTLAAYELGARMGADFIEPDLVATRDGELVCRHENEISGTTDVADHPEFAARRTRKEIDGKPYDGWFTEDFTLAELKTLRARERIPDARPENVAYDDLEIPTFAEVLALAAELGVGVYPETKHPAHHRALGLELEPRLVEALRGVSLPVYVQSFTAESLRALPRPRVQLVGRGPVDVGAIAGYADAIGPAKQLVDEALVEAAHAAGLEVHPYTFRREPQFLLDGFDSVEAELERFLGWGVDGVFTDHPDLAVRARSASTTPR
jgi:glycerophosphoryl diester phosphodiesterase